MSANRGLALLIVLATVLFVVGTSIEQGNEGQHSEPAATEEVHAEGTVEGEEVHVDEGGTEAGEQETLLGIDTESTALIVLAAAISLLLAAGVWLRPETAWLLGLVALVMLVFAALDIREVFHQGDESNTGLAVLAAVVAALHLAAAVWALRLRRPRVAA